MALVTRATLASTAAVIALAAAGLYFFSVHRNLASCLQAQAETVVTDQRKQDLVKSISSLEEDVRSLGWMKLQLKGEIHDAELRRDSVRDEIATLEEKRQQAVENLGAMEFEVIKADIEAGAASSISIQNAPLDLFYDIRAKGAEPQTEKLWPGFLEQVRHSAVGFMAQSDRNLASEVARAFEQQCGHLQNVQIDIPPLVYPEKDDPDFERKRTSVMEKEHVVSDALSYALLNLQDCLHHVHRQ